MYTIYNNYNNNNWFIAGFFLGSGVSLLFCGTLFALFGGNNMIKYD